jgi:hypothetical protein
MLDGETRGNSDALETGVMGAVAMVNRTVVYTALQLITERQRPLQNLGKGNFFQTSGLDDSFPSGHTIITWTAASTIAHEYPKPWVEWLTYGTATVKLSLAQYAKSNNQTNMAFKTHEVNNGEELAAQST